jgi:hypothetical protein
MAAPSSRKPKLLTGWDKPFCAGQDARHYLNANAGVGTAHLRYCLQVVQDMT